MTEINFNRPFLTQWENFHYLLAFSKKFKFFNQIFVINRDREIHLG